MTFTRTACGKERPGSPRPSEKTDRSPWHRAKTVESGQSGLRAEARLLPSYNTQPSMEQLGLPQQSSPRAETVTLTRLSSKTGKAQFGSSGREASRSETATRETSTTQIPPT